MGRGGELRLKRNAVSKPGRVIYVRRCRTILEISREEKDARMAAVAAAGRESSGDREEEGGFAWRNVTQLSAVIGSSLVQ